MRARKVSSQKRRNNNEFPPPAGVADLRALQKKLTYIWQRLCVCVSTSTDACASSSRSPAKKERNSIETRQAPGGPNFPCHLMSSLYSGCCSPWRVSYSTTASTMAMSSWRHKLTSLGGLASGELRSTAESG